MNFIHLFVTEIKGKPYFIFNKWFLDVKADAYENICDTHIMFNI